MNLEFENKKLEYMAAQDMLRHYDTLNWQIGSILIAGVIVLTGLVINKDTVGMMRESKWIALTLALGIPIFSAFVLTVWRLWLRRHSDLYNLRNEVFHRVEIQLRMYHHLRVVEADLNYDSQNNDPAAMRLRQARDAAGYNHFQPFYPHSKLSRLSGRTLATCLTIGIPIGQLLLLLLLAHGPPAQRKMETAVTPTVTASPSESVSPSPSSSNDR